MNKKAFSLVEMLVVLAIIGLISAAATVSLSSFRQKSRDTERLADVKEMQTALELYHLNEGSYPATLNFGGSLTGSSSPSTIYMARVPNNPIITNTPVCDGNYEYVLDPKNHYQLRFCLERGDENMAAGYHCATPSAITDCSDELISAFKCGHPITDARDGKSYQTVLINDQCWMAQNLNVGDYIGSGIGEKGYDGKPGTTDDCIDNYAGKIWSCQGYTGIQKYCYGQDDKQGGEPKNCDIYGGLYEWAEALGLPSDCNNAKVIESDGHNNYTILCPQSGKENIVAEQTGICPQGWHVPNETELHALEYSLSNDPEANCDPNHGMGNCEAAGDKLKSKSNWDGTNESGFNALAGGQRHGDGGQFSELGKITYFWSTAPSDESFFAWSRLLISGDKGIKRPGELLKASGFSLRCIAN